MKERLLILFFLGCGVFAYAQSDILRDFNQQRLDKQRSGMLILGGWAIGNLATGLALRNRNSGPEKYFHLMNAGWGAVNLALAGFGYYGAVSTDPGSFGLYESMQETQRFQKILLFNAGLDVGYVMGGLYLLERGMHQEKNSDRLKGFGRSIILQGAFLFAFDLVNYFVHSADTSELRPLMSSLYFTGQNAGIVFRF